MLLNWLLKCIGGYTNGKRNKHKQLTQSEKTDSRIFALSNAFIVLRIYCTTVCIYPSLFSPPSSAQRGDFVNIFGNFKDNVHWRINQRKSSSMSKILAFNIYWSYNITSMTPQRGTIKQSQQQVIDAKIKKLIFIHQQLLFLKPTSLKSGLHFFFIFKILTLASPSKYLN